MQVNIIWNLIQNTYIFILFVWLIAAVILRKYQHYKTYLTVSAVVYVVVLLYVTLLGRTAGTEHQMELSFLWEYRLAVDGSLYWFSQIFDNIMLFLPMGWLYGAMRSCVSWKNAIFFGACMSLAIELCQLVFKLGLFEFDDILNNTIGMTVGYGLYFILERNKKQCST